MAERPILVWLRQDLRLADNPALDAATRTGRPLLCVYVLDDQTPGRWRIGAAARWWLHHSLNALRVEIGKRGARLVLRRGRAEEQIPQLMKEVDAAAVYWNRCYEPYAIKRDAALKTAFEKAGVEAKSFNAALLFEPWTIRTKSAGPFKVFTPFWRACLSASVPRAPIAAPKLLNGFQGEARSDDLRDWRLVPTRPNWAKGFEREWRPGEDGAHHALDVFLKDRLRAYPEARDMMGEAGVSKLSPHLHWGEISPLQIWTRAQSLAARDNTLQGAIDKFLSEIGWREFSHHLLFHWPDLPEANWRAAFDAVGWRNQEAEIEAWRRGRTGYPIVDAAMRELWTHGWMHNRARMIAASFLIKHLLVDWRVGEDWFWDTLLDADLANNAASWQWVAGSGADASPYFRIFNPVAQGEKFDPDGVYVRTWLPEIARLPKSAIHTPWQASKSVLDAANVRLGETYPAPIVEHNFARQRALDALSVVKTPAQAKG